MTNVTEIAPLDDPRWDDFVENHPRGSVFHTSKWLRALRMTYGYESCALCACVNGQRLDSALVYCSVKSWLTGRRLVSLPFSDHCEPLVENAEEMQALVAHLTAGVRKGNWDYFEMRPVSDIEHESDGLERSFRYLLHTVDLQKPKDELFKSLHRDCVQRKIRRAERENLEYESGNGEELLMKFYRLFIVTRRRHRVPPQHHSWFRHLSQMFGDRLQFRLASYQGRPVAAILTLKHGDTITYKYGCSDPASSKLGGTPLLLWKTMEEALCEGFKRFDLGRSDPANAGLIQFKDHWASERLPLDYWRFPERPARGWGRWSKPLLDKAVARMPDWSLVTAGKLLYRHIG